MKEIAMEEIAVVLFHKLARKSINQYLVRICYAKILILCNYNSKLLTFSCIDFNSILSLG